MLKRGTCAGMTMSAPDEVCMALLGERLGTEDKLKLAGTRLQKLMTSEEPACKDSTQLADEQPVRTKSAGETKSQSAVQVLLGVIADEAEDEGESKDEDEERRNRNIGFHSSGQPTKYVNLLGFTPVKGVTYNIPLLLPPSCSRTRRSYMTISSSRCKSSSTSNNSSSKSTKSSSSSC